MLPFYFINLFLLEHDFVSQNIFLNFKFKFFSPRSKVIEIELKNKPPPIVLNGETTNTTLSILLIVNRSCNCKPVGNISATSGGGIKEPNLISLIKPHTHTKTKKWVANSSSLLGCLG
jgi:hypothetical protein